MESYTKNYQFYESIKTPLEKEFNKIQTVDFSQLSHDEVAKYIQEFVLKGSDTLKGFIEKNDYFKYDKMSEMYRKGLEKLSADALVQISDDYRANNANAMVKGKLIDINRVSEISKQIETLEDLEFFGEELKESDKETHNTLLTKLREARVKVCENSIVNLEEKAFLGEEIGKATIDIEISKKDLAQQRTNRDTYEIQKTIGEHTNI